MSFLADVGVKLYVQSQDVADKFPAALRSPAYLEQIPSDVIVTEVMKTLYQSVLEDTPRSICLVGPPGCGKTTSLIWLYEQLCRDSQISPLVFRLHDTADLFKRQITQCKGQKIIVLVDLKKPGRIIDNEKVNELFATLGQVHKVVLAVSSGFVSRLRETDHYHDFASLFSAAKTIMCLPFTLEQAKVYLKSLRKEISDVDVDMIVQLTNGIPRLMCYGFFEHFKEKIVFERNIEFISAIEALPINYCTGLDIQILLACYYQTTLASFKVKINQAKASVLVIANLVKIDVENCTAQSYFKLDENFLGLLNRKVWLEYSNKLKITSQSALGNAFEGAIASSFVPVMPIIYCPVQSPDRILSIDLKFSNVLGKCIPYVGQPLEDDILYCVMNNFPGIDLVSVTNIEGASTLVGVQVTIQQKNRTAKLRKTLENFPCNIQVNYQQVLLIVVNPNWVTPGFELVCEITEPKDEDPNRYTTWHYGELTDKRRAQAILAEVEFVHSGGYKQTC